MIRRLPELTLFPYTTLFRSIVLKYLRVNEFNSFDCSINHFDLRDMLYRITTQTRLKGGVESTLWGGGDRKSTRLNSSHTVSSNAGFRLTQNKTARARTPATR